MSEPQDDYGMRVWVEGWRGGVLDEVRLLGGGCTVHSRVEPRGCTTGVKGRPDTSYGVLVPYSIEPELAYAPMPRINHPCWGFDITSQ